MAGRRLVLKTFAGLAVAKGLPVWAQDAQMLETIPLWPGTPPDGPGPSGPEATSAKGSVTRVVEPRLRVYLPAQSNGCAMLVIAGGGYAHIECGHESTPAARWLQAQGVTAFELVYRLPREGWAQPLVPLQDGQRAMRLIRAGAQSFGIDAARIGVLGFSAGAHLAGMTAVAPDAPRYAPVDAADAVSARPDCAALIYPVLTMLPPFDHTHARRELLGARRSAAAGEALSVEMLVTPAAPPMFLAQAVDDTVSPVDNSLRMFAALRQAKVAAALHLFTTGQHGWGMGPPGSEVAAWPGLFATWAGQHRWWR
ncbi:alpha/beta hydrolase [Rhodoferax koreense]|uniref:alpha/beta hydrolase n=1 Tax=Rhodoferax koreensis TaxID=1842727 RepID=UPI00269D8C87